MSFHWPYYILRDGYLFSEHGRRVFRNAPRFDSVAAAEQWLVDQDERGNVKDW